MQRIGEETTTIDYHWKLTPLPQLATNTCKSFTLAPKFPFNSSSLPFLPLASSLSFSHNAKDYYSTLDSKL